MRLKSVISIVYILILIQGAELENQSAGHVGTRFSWSGHEWQVKIKDEPAGPGPNVFGLHTENVRLTRSKALQLSVLPTDNGWSCAEIFSSGLLRNGLFLFEVSGHARNIHPQLVAGMFTYNESLNHHYNESDVEISSWGSSDIENAQFAHYAYNQEPEVHRFWLSEKSNVHTFIIHKTRGEITFYYLDRKFSPKVPRLHQVKAFYRLSNITHQPDFFRIHINLWLYKGEEPVSRSSKDAYSLVVNRFEYLPY